MLEVYHETRNVFGPPQEFKVPAGVSGDRVEAASHRFQDIFIQFLLINIGGVRAEDILLNFSGELDKDQLGSSIRELGIFNTVISQLAPGQVILLFRMDDHDLYRYSPEGGKFVGMKEETFTISVSYNGPNRGLNRLLRLWRRGENRRQYEEGYTFDPKIVSTDLPAPEYSG
jgi:hypothetical protein